MPQEFEGTPEQIDLVEKITIQAYDHYARTRLLIRENIPQGNYCDPISYFLVHALRDYGFNAKYRYYFNDEAHAVHIHVGLGNNWIADAQWQQFLGRTDNPLEVNQKKPLQVVIIARLETVPDLLTGYGITKEDMAFWMNAHELEV